MDMEGITYGICGRTLLCFGGGMFLSASRVSDLGSEFFSAASSFSPLPSSAGSVFLDPKNTRLSFVRFSRAKSNPAFVVSSSLVSAAASMPLPDVTCVT